MADPSSDYGNSMATQASNTGNSAINSFDPTSFGNSFKSGVNNLFSSQMGAGSPQNSQDYYNLYKQSIANNPTATQLYDQANSQFNVQPLAQNANTLQNAVLQAPSQNQAMARGFNFDQNQVQNATNYDLMRLSPLATAATNQAQTAEGLASNYVNYGLQQNATNLLPVQQQGQMLADAMARQSTGYTTAMQSELDGLKAKMAAGVQLSQYEMERANTLATAESQYQRAMIQQSTSLGTTAMTTDAQKYVQNLPYATGIYGGNITYGPKFGLKS